MNPSIPTLSVCLVTFNSADTIAECLESVRAQRDVALEMIVVDNASHDDSAARAEAVAGVRVIRNLRNVFFAPANNQALRASRGEFVLVLNPDTVLEPDTAARMIRALRERPDVGAAICTIMGNGPQGETEVPHWWARRSLRDLLGSFQPWLWWRERLGGNATNNEVHSARDVDVISDACLFARRAALETIGWYDERYKLYFTEDDLCHRLWAVGWRVQFLPVTRVHHHGSTSTRKVPRLWLRWLTVQDTLAYARQHLGTLAFIALAWASALDLALVAGVRAAKRISSRPTKTTPPLPLGEGRSKGKDVSSLR